MSDINTYANEAAITALSNPINGDLVLNQDNNSVYLCTNAELAGLARWKKFAHDDSAAAEAYVNRWAAYFNGSNHMTTDYTPATSSGATISLWIKMPNLTLNSAPYVSGDGTNAAAGSLSFILHKTIGYYVQVGNGTSASLHHSSTGFGTGNAVTLSSSNGYITDNLWHHLAVTINGTAIKLYIDGGDASINASRTSNNQGTPYLTATSSISYTGGIGSVTKIGQGHPTFYPNIAACLMDEIAYFESALTGSQVSALYNSGVPGNSSLYEPSMWFRMGDHGNDSPTDGIATPSISDSSGNGYTLSQVTASKQPAWSDLTGETIYIS